MVSAAKIPTTRARGYIRPQHETFLLLGGARVYEGDCVFTTPLIIEVDTPHGLARAHLHPVARPRAALVLGHGAGGGVEAPDLVAAREAALAESVSVVLVEQPYRVAGRRAPAPAAQLDAAWGAVVERLAARAPGLPLVVGGRSLGARVACRTAAGVGAAGVLCLAFPVHPPGRPRRAASRSSMRSPCRRSSSRASAIRSAFRRRAPAARWCSCRATTA